MDVSVKEDPCKSCDGPNCRFKPKEEKMNETARPNYEEELKRTREQLEKAREEIAALNRTVQGQRNELAMMKGEIEGLRFAIRCNGVSGAEVRERLTR